MAIKYSFVDNVTYGTDDINAIVGDLTGAGVAPFPTQDTYSTSDFNTLTEAIVSSGTSLDGCKCTVSNAATANMTVTVAQGIIFFESGVRLTVDGDGYVISVTPNTAGYVFAHYSPALQVADVVFDTEIPTDGEFVLLAELAINGAITDRRTFARSKVATFGANLKQSAEFTVLDEPIAEGMDGNYKILLTRKLENVDLSKFHYAFISFMQIRGFYDLSTGKFAVSYVVNNDGSSEGTVRCNTTILNYLSNSTTVEVIKRDNALFVKQKSVYTGDAFPTYPMTAELI